MQDIVFYAAVNETQGIVRDSANARNQAAPILVLGVSACLKMRLFAACNVATPYPISSLGGISDWNWRMDADFDRDTPSKLVADAGGISVRTVTDTVDGETVNFTEFVIPISDMNTQELTDWLGNEKKRSGLIGELVGYDSEGNAVFVLQIDDFTVRNRVAGLGDPTAIEQEVATRSQTVQMIRAAVSSSAATKQDRLTSANAGANISIDENGVISNTYSLPSATTESRGGVILATAAETKSGSNATKAITPACFLSALSGNDQIIAKSAIQAFQPIIELGSATSATIAPGSAYRLSAVSGNHYLTVSDVPADKYGTDAHVELFVGGTTLVHVLDPLILMDALIPNAVNDCVIKFRDGTARLFVEDHAYGYVVTVAGGTGGTVFGGSLHYGLTGATASYIAFANSLNGQTVILPETASVNRAVNIVGNGYTQTVISGGISCTSKTTFSNLGMNGVSVLGGTAILGDVYIPSGATVSVRGGGLAVEKVTGDGGTIDLGGTNIMVQWGSSAVVSGCTFSGGRTASSTIPGGAFNISGGGRLELDTCVVTQNSAYNGGGLAIYSNSLAIISSTIVSENSGTSGADIAILGGTVHAINAAIGMLAFNGGTVMLAQSNSIKAIGRMYGGSGTVTISSGAVVDLTGNSNATPINPGGGVTFAPGGATVYPNAGSASAYMLGGMTVPQIGNSNVINLGGTYIFTSETAYASGCTFSGGSGTYGGAIRFYSSGILSSCTFSGNNATYGRDIALIDGAKVTIVGCSFSTVGGVYLRGNNNTSTTVHASDTELQQVELAGENTSLTLAGNIVEKYRILDTGKVFISSGATVDLTDNTYTTPINPGGGVTFAPGGATVYPSAGSASAYSFEGVAQSLSNTNTVIVDRNFPSHASGCSITFTNAAAPVAAAGGSSSVLSNCSLYTEASSMYITGFGNSGTLIVGGTVSFNAQLIGANAAAKANLTLLDSATLDMTGVSGAFPVQCQSGTLTVGSNCTFITSGSTAVLLNNGVHTKCSVGAEGNMLCATYTPNYYAKIQNFVSCTSSAFISSGTIIDLTGNTNSVPIKAAGGVTFAPGGATVYPSAGSASAYMLGGMTVPQIGNTNVVNLKGGHVVLTGNKSAYASGCTFTSGSATTGGALYLNTSASITLRDTIVSGNTGATGAGMYLDSPASALITGGTFTGNEIYAASGATVKIENIRLVATRIWGGGNIVVSSGALIDLTSNGITTTIAGGGGITLYGGLSGNLTAIIGSGGVSRTFEECEVHGSTITSLGLIYGATIYPGQYGHDVTYTEDGGTTSSSTLVGADSSFVVPGGLMKVEKYD